MHPTVTQRPIRSQTGNAQNTQQPQYAPTQAQPSLGSRFGQNDEDPVTGESSVRVDYNQPVVRIVSN